MDPAVAREQDPAAKEIVNKVRKFKEHADAAKKPYVPRWREWYGLHRNYRRYARAYSDADSQADRDEVRNDAQREFGAELFIPMAFSTIETVLPRVLMNNPRMRVKPKQGLSPDSADAIREMYEERQTEIDFSLKLQPIARRGLKYGLGVGKVFWDVEGRTVPVTGPKQVARTIQARLTGQPDPAPFEFVVDSQGPSVEDVEIEDFFWDPSAKDMRTCRRAMHRTWRDEGYIREMVSSGKWLPVDVDKLPCGDVDSARTQMLSERAEYAGLQGFDSNQGKLYEVWEYHDGEMVHTLVGGSVLVQSAPNPFHHRRLPFVIYRPTMQEGEFVGVGELEPIVHLQYELNTLRSQRRDNATLVLQKAFMYAEGLVDPADLIVGPGKGIPVYGNPNEVIVPLSFGEIPASGYQEEQAIKADIESTSGLADTLSGGSGASNASAETATGIQLVQAAANVRVEMKTKNLHAEVLKPMAKQWREQWIQNADTAPYVVTVADPSSQSGWAFKQVTREELELVREVLPEEDSTGPENKPQIRNDALALYNQTRGNEVVDPRKAIRHLLRAFEVPDAEEWVIPEATQMNPQVAQVVGESLVAALIENGLPQEKAEPLVLMAMQQAMAQTGVSEPPNAEGDPSMNGNGAAPAEAPA